jgi:hypothetical protein
MRRLLTALAATVSLAVPATSEAARVSDGTLDFAHEAGQTFWTKRGFETCPGKPRVWYRQRNRPNADWVAWAWLWGDPKCRIVLNSSTNWGALGSYYGHTGRATVCAVVIHESGHLAGLEHTSRGIMRGDSTIAYPRICGI